MVKPTLYMLMGLPCSGKTTLARKLEQQKNALFLDTDAWMSKIVRNGFDFERRAAIHDVQFTVAGRVLKLRRNVVLDFGFFFRADRDAGRTIAEESDASAQLIFVDPPYEELLRRIELRNRSLPPNTFHITQEHLDLCQSWIERPQADEPLTSVDDI